MWMAILSFLGGPVIKGLIDAYQAKLKAGNVESKIAADLAATEIAAEVTESNAILQYRIAEIGHWYEPDKLMGYFVALYFGKLLVWDKVLGLGTTDSLAGFASVTSNLVVSFISPNADLRTSRGSSSDDRRDRLAMNEMRSEYIRAIVAETLAEQQRLRHDDINAVVAKTVATILISFGIEEGDRKELRADFQHLRRWRKSVEQAQSFTFKAVITIIVTGFVGAVWLGAKVMLGK
jgi:hypothetical protein